MTATARVEIGHRLPDDFHSVVDQRDQEIAEGRELAYLEAVRDHANPLVGEFAIINGKYRRVAYDWGDSLQWCENGSFHIGKSGCASMSGSLERGEPVDEFQPTSEFRQASYWFFHHDHAGAHRAVHMTLAVRVWRHVPKDGREVLSCKESLARRRIGI